MRERRNAALALLLLTALLLFFLSGCAADAVEDPTPTEPVITEPDTEEGEDPHEAEKIEAALLAKANRIDDCTITYYCCELRPHICGTGDGLTATGSPVMAGISCAVDPDVIPLGSTVMVDYGDGIIHYYLAEDVGGAVDGDHIDLAVATHEEALQLGVKKATVYWVKEG